MHSESKRLITLYDMPEDLAGKLVEVLSNDLKEYELDGDFGTGTEESIRIFVEELQKHLQEKGTSHSS